MSQFHPDVSPLLSTSPSVSPVPLFCPTVLALWGSGLMTSSECHCEPDMARILALDPGTATASHQAINTTPTDPQRAPSLTCTARIRLGVGSEHLMKSMWLLSSVLTWINRSVLTASLSVKSQDKMWPSGGSFMKPHLLVSWDKINNTDSCSALKLIS